MSVPARLHFGLALGALLGLGTVAGSALAQDPTSGDPAAGEKVVKKCLACHVLEPGKKKVGPSLHGVVGRAPGSVEGFKYSKAMVAFGEDGKIWDEVLIDQFIADPKKLVKGTRMTFRLKKPEDRANVIAYLKQLAQ